MLAISVATNVTTYFRLLRALQIGPLNREGELIRCRTDNRPEEHYRQQGTTGPDDRDRREGRRHGSGCEMEQYLSSFKVAGVE